MTIDRLSRWLATALMVLAIPAAAVAQEIAPDHLELARKYADMTDRARVYEQSVLNTGVQASRTLIAQSPDLSEPISQATISVIEGYESEEERSRLLDQFARIYAIHYTPDELREIIAFYETDVGQRLLQDQAQINQELQAALTVFRNNLNTEFMSRLKARLAEEGYDL